ncbi:hypothetical protein [Acinetobacter bereziniae]|uniref:hypothetical protein n=1 Tax=Acinetobacter bereziniae TaxID=106648 RepID=UPI000664F03B|nr:hypothetical protein [Acinetobacter bereziniae]
MTTLRIIRDVKISSHKPVQYEPTKKLVETAGYDAEFLKGLHQVQSFLKEVETKSASHFPNLFKPLDSSDPLTLNFYPDSLTSFGDINLNINATEPNLTFEVPIWRRFYKYEPSDTQPIYIMIEGGTKGLGTSGWDRSCVPWFNISFAYDYSEINGLIGVVKKVGFGVHLVYNYTVASVNYLLDAKFVCQITDDVFNLYFHSTYCRDNQPIFLGLNNSYTYPVGIPTGIILAKAKEFIVGEPEKYVAVAITPQCFNSNYGTSATDPYADFGNLRDHAYFIYPEAWEIRNSPTPLGCANLTVNSPGRMYISKFTYCTQTGSVYDVNGLVWLTNPDRSKLDFQNTTVKFLNSLRKVSILPMLNPLIPLNNSMVLSANSIRMGVILDDSIIEE